MKILTILLILLQINTFGYGNYSSHYSNRYNSYNCLPVEQTNRKIGYTTNYGNTFGYTTQQTYRGTYTPAASSSGGRHGSPRKSPTVPDYDEEDGWGNWSSIFGILNKDAWRYYVTERADMFWSQVDWSNPANYNNEGLKKLWYSDHEGQTPPWEPYMTPIGDPDFYLITALLFSYFIYNYMKKRRQQFLLYTN